MPPCLPVGRRRSLDYSSSWTAWLLRGRTCTSACRTTRVACQPFSPQYGIEDDGRAVIEYAKAIAFDLRVVCEHILSIRAIDESEPLLGIEPLHSTFNFYEFLRGVNHRAPSFGSAELHGWRRTNTTPGRRSWSSRISGLATLSRPIACERDLKQTTSVQYTRRSWSERSCTQALNRGPVLSQSAATGSSSVEVESAS
jgi:hypothetical protein